MRRHKGMDGISRQGKALLCLPSTFKRCAIRRFGVSNMQILASLHVHAHLSRRIFTMKCLTLWNRNVFPLLDLPPKNVQTKPGCCTLWRRWTIPTLSLQKTMSHLRDLATKHVRLFRITRTTSSVVYPRSKPVKGVRNGSSRRFWSMSKKSLKRKKRTKKMMKPRKRQWMNKHDRNFKLRGR